jgi:hypothetical protein
LRETRAKRLQPVSKSAECFVVKLFRKALLSSTDTELEGAVSGGHEFSLLYVVQTDYEVHPTSYPMCTAGKADGA